MRVIQWMCHVEFSTLQFALPPLTVASSWVARMQFAVITMSDLSVQIWSAAFDPFILLLLLCSTISVGGRAFARKSTKEAVLWAHPPYCLQHIIVNLTLVTETNEQMRLWSDGSFGRVLSAPCDLLPPGEPGGRGAQHGHCPSPRCQSAQLVCSSCIAAIVWRCPLCTMGQRQRVKEWTSKRKGSNCGTEKDKNTIAAGSDRERALKIHTGSSTEGVAGFTLTRRRPLGLSFDTMHRRVRTYSHIKMKRYRYACSRYIHQFVSQAFGCFLTKLWLPYHPFSCTLSHIQTTTRCMFVQVELGSRGLFEWSDSGGYRETGDM